MSAPTSTGAAADGHLLARRRRHRVSDESIAKPFTSQFLVVATEELRQCNLQTNPRALSQFGQQRLILHEPQVASGRGRHERSHIESSGEKKSNRGWAGPSPPPARCEMAVRIDDVPCATPPSLRDIGSCRRSSGFKSGTPASCANQSQSKVSTSRARAGDIQRARSTRSGRASDQTRKTLCAVRRPTPAPTNLAETGIRATDLVSNLRPSLICRADVWVHQVHTTPLDCVAKNRQLRCPVLAQRGAEARLFQQGTTP